MNNIIIGMAIVLYVYLITIPVRQKIRGVKSE